MHGIRHTVKMRKDALLHIIITITTNLSSYTDSFRVSVPARRLAAAKGDSVVLGCEFSPDLQQSNDLSTLMATWQRQENDRVVHSFYYMKDQVKYQDSAYKNRTSMFVNELRNGNASVRIVNVGREDAGHYVCIVSTSQGTDKAYLQLDYGALYTDPKLTINVHSSEILVQYETEGFPEPELSWQGGHGENLSDHIQTTMRSNEEMDLYYIKSSYTAPKTLLNFSFILKNQLLDQSLQMHVIFDGGKYACFYELLAVFIAIALIVLLIVAIVVYCKKK